MHELKRLALRAAGVHFFRFAGGVGDHLLCTTVAREVGRRRLGPVVMLSQYRDLFRDNPDVALVVPPGGRAERLARALLTPTDLGYNHRDPATGLGIDYDPETDTATPPQEHILAIMCRKAGITGRIRLRAYFYLLGHERRAAVSFRGFVAIQSSVLSARYPSPNKEWGAERFARVASALLQEHRVVQIGDRRDPAVPCTVDLRGRTSLRQLAAVLANCRLFVGPEGFPMHLARAVECPSVIVLGGRLAPWQTGYACNANLYTQTPCAPCWSFHRCEHDRVCLGQIRPEDVLAAADAMLAAPRGELACETLNLGTPARSACGGLPSLALRAGLL
jgi:ADP-heptose:LPS heptosyltransferase